MAVTDIIERARTMLDSILPWPWKWTVHPEQKVLQLEGRGRYIFATHRWGFNGAQLWFYNHDTHLLDDVSKVMKPIEGRAHHASWIQTIDHPDANFIAAAPELVAGLLTLLKYPSMIPGVFTFSKTGALMTTITRDLLAEAIGDEHDAHLYLPGKAGDNGNTAYFYVTFLEGGGVAGYLEAGIDYDCMHTAQLDSSHALALFNYFRDNPTHP